MLAPIDLVTVNARGATRPDFRRLGNRVLASAAGRGPLGVVVEADDLDPAQVLDPDTFWWRHHGGSDYGDGVLIFGAHDRTRPHAARWLPGAPASPVSAARPVVRVRVEVDDEWALTLGGLHLPRTGDGGMTAHRRMVGASKRYGCDVLSGDLNLHRAGVLAAYPGREARGLDDDVIWTVGGPRVQLGTARGFDVVKGTTLDDHRGIVVPIQPAVRRG